MIFMCKYRIYIIKRIVCLSWIACWFLQTFVKGLFSYIACICENMSLFLNIHFLKCCSRFEIGINRTEDTEQVVIPVCLREKFRHSGYSHHSGSTHFGQPFLIAVPRNNTEDKLYNLLLLRMWYVYKKICWKCILTNSIENCSAQEKGRVFGIHKY